MFLSIVQLILVPLILGMLLRQWQTNIYSQNNSNRQKSKPCDFYSIHFICSSRKSRKYKTTSAQGLLIVMVHNGLMYLCPWVLLPQNGWVDLPKMPAPSLLKRAFKIRTRPHSYFQFFNGNGGMALIAAWWSVWHLVSSFVLALYWKRHPVRKIIG